MYTVYALYSADFDKLYIGYTSNLEQRLKSHNELGKKDWTKRYRPWILVHSESFQDKTSAIRREKELKTGRGREFLRKLIPKN
ncbi:GIY-YIG nuclease family protein [Negadavirga shengliensis]|uniref:GIY-YIG nuclease family protein n=1 Tax=Negadavirga shengliensis TaxID=1389218 RepID=A0ABV9SXN3_9BACT